MKRTRLKRKTPLKASRTTKNGAKRLSDASFGAETTKSLKKKIQAVLRQIVIKRDKVCQRCGVPYGTEGVVFQCDHLLSRSHSATYANEDLCVLLCKPCHAWKSLGSNLRQKEFDEMIRSKISKERIDLWDRELEWRHTATKQDWKLHLLRLEQVLKKLSTEL